jgi:hypothetical protein
LDARVLGTKSRQGAFDAGIRRARGRLISSWRTIGRGQLQRSDSLVSVTQLHCEVVISMATREDVDMVDATVKVKDTTDYADLLQTNHSDAFAFSQNEQLALELYDKLIEMELEQSLLVAQHSGTNARQTTHLGC